MGDLCHSLSPNIFLGPWRKCTTTRKVMQPSASQDRQTGPWAKHPNICPASRMKRVMLMCKSSRSTCRMFSCPQKIAWERKQISWVTILDMGCKGRIHPGAGVAGLHFPLCWNYKVATSWEVTSKTKNNFPRGTPANRRWPLLPSPLQIRATNQVHLFGSCPSFLLNISGKTICKWTNSSDVCDQPSRVRQRV